ncbi:hypothetical protein [Microbacterium esteraromaticum]|uniref:hypothetical protein n=1 Tax=Microbacterium esteraromaticum TaxID=57043 RepID=UPI0019D3F4F3|nr:hypothetical protein [Microbacterium esteraromaticum]MBN7793806.1 hypothetical protein [Microbacterium esteraromaticum]
MEPNPLRTTLDTLRSEREDAERDAIELDHKLKAVAQRLTHLRGAIDNIEALLGVPSAEDEAVLIECVDEQPSGATVREIDFTNTPDGPPAAPTPSTTPPEGPETTFGAFEPVVRKRVPSTNWVAEVVDRVGRPADRDTIFAAFGEIKGFPESWTNPRNSVNNALGRAVERGMVRKINENLFAPIGFKPVGSDSTDREES